MNKDPVLHIDEWVWYKQFYDSKDEHLQNMKQKALILYIYEDKIDKTTKYRIFIDETGKTINVRAAYLFPIIAPNY